MSISLDEEWPGTFSYVVVRVEDARVTRLLQYGDLDVVRPWASVSKVVVALAFGADVDAGQIRYDDVVGPGEATFAHLLSHASGLGLEIADPSVALATKRIYSNAGIDRVVELVAGQSGGQWLHERVLSPLAMSSSALVGRAAAGMVGSTNDLAALALAWLRPDVVSRATRDRIIQPFAPSLAGIVPGFGRFSPCPWGLGPEIRGSKQHWMGDWPEESFGHFGQSGALVLVNADEGLALVATSDVAFGPWAAQLWPRWTSAVRHAVS